MVQLLENFLLVFDVVHVLRLNYILLFHSLDGEFYLRIRLQVGQLHVSECTFDVKLFALTFSERLEPDEVGRLILVTEELGVLHALLRH